MFFLATHPDSIAFDEVNLDSVRLYTSRFHPLAVCKRLLDEQQRRLLRALERFDSFGPDVSEKPVLLDSPANFDTLYRSSTTMQASKTHYRTLTIVADLLRHFEALVDAVSESDEDGLVSICAVVALIPGDRVPFFLNTVSKMLSMIALGDISENGGKRGLIWGLARVETSAERTRSMVARNDLYSIRQEKLLLEGELAKSRCNFCLIEMMSEAEKCSSIELETSFAFHSTSLTFPCSAPRYPLHPSISVLEIALIASVASLGIRKPRLGRKPDSGGHHVANREAPHPRRQVLRPA